MSCKNIQFSKFHMVYYFYWHDWTCRPVSITACTCHYNACQLRFPNHLRDCQRDWTNYLLFTINQRRDSCMYILADKVQMCSSKKNCFHYNPFQHIFCMLQWLTWPTSICLHKLNNCILSGFPHHEIMKNSNKSSCWILAAETFTSTTHIII